MPAMTMPFLPRDFFDPSGGYTERDAASPLAARLIIGRDAALGAIDDAESRMDKFALACVRDKDRPPSLELLGVFAQRSEQVLTARSSLRLLRRLLFKNTCVLEEAHHRWVSEMSIQMVITSKELTSWSILDLDASLSSDPDAGADDKQLSNAFSGASRGVSQMKVVIRMDALLRPADNEAEHGEDDDLPAYAFVHAAEAEKTIMQMGKLATTNTTSARYPIAYRALVLLTLKAVTQSNFEAMTKLHILTYALRLRALVRNNVTSAVNSAEELNLLRSVFYSDVKSDLKEIDDLPSCAQVDEVAVASISDIQEQFLALCNGACRETDVLYK
ncbi:hypothetical protein I4F81_008537 [Pyropia yezoensis]|uniref:Uncharacterized protein n=1 Tax=Pyropia yezoensis TaxID=2788 RepID=A0ACC3C766_PYRYE|nr:hypothetical protein I4F81_008537 [Neopyropia yezoensis]